MTNFDYDTFNWEVYFKLDENSPSGLVWKQESKNANNKTGQYIFINSLKKE